MKRALLLTYYVPPRPSIASVRVGQIIKRLWKHGWDVVPVTPDFGDKRLIPYARTTGVVDFKAPMRRLLGVKPAQTTHEYLRVERGIVGAPPSFAQRVLRLGYEVTEYANRSFGWVFPGSRAIGEMLRGEHVDAIISTSPPVATHVVAARIHGAIPWVADLRDPWQHDSAGPRPPMLHAIDAMIEPRVLRGASAITTVSEPIAESLRKRYPHVPVFTIPNAFSNDDWDGVPFGDPPRATFLYAGQLYAGRRDPRPFFASLAQLLHEGLVKGDEVHVDFYGDSNEWLRAQIARYGLGGIVTMHGRRTREEVLPLERAASRLLLLLSDDPNERGTYTGKFFEYLGARRKILAVGGPPENVIDEVLHRTGAGERYRTEAGIRDAIMQTVREWRDGRTPIVEPDAVAAYEAEALGERFARILDQLAHARVLARV